MNRSFCILPWVGVHYGCDGLIYPCCYMNQKGFIDHTLGRVDEGIEKAWNSNKLKNLRLKMLSGEYIDACSGCYNREKLGYESFRQWKNKNNKHNMHLVSNTKPDGGLEFEGFKYFEFKISNKCNLKCRICDPGSSNSLYKEQSLFNTNYTKILNPFNTIDDFKKEFLKHIDSIDMIYFFGGEPFIIDEHYEALKLLIDNKKTDIEIHYSTNMSKFDYKNYNLPDLWKHFKKIVLIASLDGSGRRAEYMRKNSIWSETIKIRKKLLEFKNVDFYIMSSINIFNLTHIFDFHKEWILKNYIKPENIIFNMVFYPDHLSYNVITPEIKQLFLDKAEEHIKFLKTYINEQTINSINTENVIFKIQQIINEIKNIEVNREKINLFLTRTFLLDKIRKENFVLIFPELYSLLNYD